MGLDGTFYKTYEEPGGQGLIAMVSETLIRIINRPKYIEFQLTCACKRLWNVTK